MKPVASRAFKWVSSVGEPNDELKQLEQRMSEFYSAPSRKTTYQQVDLSENHQPEVESQLIKAIMARKPRSIFELGVGSGRLLQAIRKAGYTGSYTGMEMSPEVIASNQKKFPDSEFIVGGANDIAQVSQRYDVVFAYFVLEHIVFPEKALSAMSKLLSPSGAVFLVFPDFIRMNLLPSQRLGYLDQPFRKSLREGKILRGLVGLFDSRIRLRRALRHVHRDVGRFPVNVAPVCLSISGPITPDQDAVYISSRMEVADWARANGYQVSFPAGDNGTFAASVLLQFTR